MTVETRRVWVATMYIDDVGDSYEVGATIECTFSPVSASTREFLRSVLGADIADRVTDEELSRVVDPSDPLIVAVVRSIDRARWRMHPLAADSPDPDAPRFYAAPGSVVIETISSTSRGEVTNRVRVLAEVAETAVEFLGYAPTHGFLIDLEILERYDAEQ